MIDTSKHADYFNPVTIKEEVHIVGCGAIGSHVAEMLIRLGIDHIHLWDFDTIGAHNLANQMYLHADIGKPKTDCLKNYLLQIDPTAVITTHGAWENTALNGYIFLAADSVTVCRNIIELNRYNPYTKAFFDFRMRLSDAQHYAAIPADAKRLLDSMDFTQEEALAATPVSACGTSLSVLPTVKTIVALGIANFINYTKGEPLKKLILIDAFMFTLDAY